LLGRVLRVEAAYLIRAAMVPLLNRHSSWEAVHLPMESYLQLLSEASHVQPIRRPLIVSEAGYVDGSNFASHGIAVPVLSLFVYLIRAAMVPPFHCHFSW
jgi:hypothetical protein